MNFSALVSLFCMVASSTGWARSFEDVVSTYTTTEIIQPVEYKGLAFANNRGTPLLICKLAGYKVTIDFTEVDARFSSGEKYLYLSTDGTTIGISSDFGFNSSLKKLISVTCAK